VSAFLRGLRPRLSYANVVATLALFVALGGASYAAAVLPAGSVGTAQLKPGAVTPGKLAFPSGVASATGEPREDLSQNECNGGGWPPNLKVAPDCLPPPLGVAPAIPTVHLRLRLPGELVISALVGMSKQGQPQTRANVRTGLVLDGRPIPLVQRGGASEYADFSEATSIQGGQSTEVPIEAVVPVRAGSHAVGIARSAEYSGDGPGDVIVGRVSVIVIELPGA
jgi:hypothetical protein